MKNGLFPDYTLENETAAKNDFTIIQPNIGRKNFNQSIDLIVTTSSVDFPHLLEIILIKLVCRTTYCILAEFEKGLYNILA